MWKKAHLRIGLLLLAASVLGLPAAAQEIKIAVVDLEVIVAQSASGKELQSRLEKFQQEIQGEVERLQAEARDIRQQITDGINSLSEDKLAELQKKFEDQSIAIRRYRDDKQREGQKMQSEGLREIEKQLQPVFEKIRDEGGYDLILNYVPGVVVMANDRVNITQKVIDRLNSEGIGTGGGS